MNAMRLREGQEIVKEEMLCVLDDDWCDTLDEIAVRLQDVYEYTAQEADDIVSSEWWMV